MKKIYKAIVQPGSIWNEHFVITVKMPAGARAISVGKQAEDVCVWFEVEPSANLEPTRLFCIGTGHGTVPDNSRFIGTVIDGFNVWHFYSPVG